MSEEQSENNPLTWLNELFVAKHRIEQLEDDIKLTREVCNDFAKKALSVCADIEQLRSIASDLYWKHGYRAIVKEYLKEQGIRDAVGFLNPEPMRLTCRDCKQLFTYYPTSGADQEFHKDGTGVCEPCWAKRRDNNAYEAWIKAKQEQIQHLRAMPYREYLQTEHWQDLRQRMLKRSKFKCQVCNRSGQLQVHHRTYERRGYEELSDLIVLCANCHSTFHEHGTVES